MIFKESDISSPVLLTGPVLLVDHLYFSRYSEAGTRGVL